MGKAKNKITNWSQYSQAFTQRRNISEVQSDGAYDTREYYKALKQKQIIPLIPPRKNAVLWEDSHPRNNAVLALKTGKLAVWKVDNGYHARQLSETAMY